MILFVIMETEAKYRTLAYSQKKYALEQAAGDHCLVVHYRELNAALLRRVRPVSICYSGSGTPFEEYDVMTCPGVRAAMRRWPVAQLGICGGHQIMAVAFGGTLGIMRRLRPEDPDLNPNYHTGDFKEWGVYPVTVTRPDPLFRGLGSLVRVQEFHRLEVKKLGPDMLPLASSANCPIQAFRHRTLPLYGVQFHPEEASEHYPDGHRILRNFFAIARRTARKGARSS